MDTTSVMLNFILNIVEYSNEIDSSITIENGAFIKRFKHVTLIVNQESVMMVNRVQNRVFFISSETEPDLSKDIKNIFLAISREESI